MKSKTQSGGAMVDAYRRINIGMVRSEQKQFKSATNNTGSSPVLATKI